MTFTKSYFIGDKMQDMETGRAASCRTVLISSLGEAGISSGDNSIHPDYVAVNVAQASRWIVEQGG